MPEEELGDFIKAFGVVADKILLCAVGFAVAQQTVLPLLISETIRRVMGENVTLISSGREAAKSCRTVLEENGLLMMG